MSVLETLEIVIEADRSGLESQLKRAGQSITSFVSQMNNQQVSWTSILSKSITPALMASIASTFAVAISQALQFQNAVQQASLNTTTSFGNTSSKMTNSAYDISSATGQSATDVEEAIGKVSSVYKNYSDAVLVASNVSKFATTEHMSMANAIDMLLPLLQQWNVSAADSADIMATLGQSTSFGKIPIDELARSLANAGSSLQKITSLPKAITQLQEASAVSGVTPDGILNQFDVIVSGANNTKKEVNAIFGDMKSAIETGGLGQALDLISTKIQGWGSNAQIIGQQFGLSTSAINQDLNGTADMFKTVDAVAKDALAVMKPLGDWFNDNKTAIDNLKIAFSQFMAELQKFVIPEALKVFTGMFDTFKGATEFIDAIKTQGIGKVLGDTFSGLVQGVNGGLVKNMGDSNKGNSSAPVTNNYTVHQNMNINAPAGSEAQTGEGIMKAAYNGLNR